METAWFVVGGASSVGWLMGGWMDGSRRRRRRGFWVGMLARDACMPGVPIHTYISTH